MPSVLFWPGVGGGTEWYRCRTPGEALRRRGWDVVYWEGEDTNLAVDVVVLQRVIFDGVDELVRRLRAHGVRVVYDIDDWYDSIPAYNPASRGVTAETLDHLHAAMTAADLITCSTAELAEGYAHLGQTIVLPNYLDPLVWSEVRRVPSVKVRVGWIGTFNYRADDLALLKPWVRPWLKQHPDVEFVAIGCPELLDYLGVGGRATPSGVWDYRMLPRMAANLDVGLVPLAFNRFNQAKSWVKGLEYNAGGVPFVASPSREYRAFVEPGVNGLFARTVDDWPRQLDAVVGELDGFRAGARKVADEYRIDDHIDRWVDAYDLASVAA